MIKLLVIEILRQREVLESIRKILRSMEKAAWEHIPLQAELSIKDDEDY